VILCSGRYNFTRFALFYRTNFGEGIVIDSTPGEQAILETIPGVGYCLRKPPAVAHE
jgi:hypothetical protein